jgi:hypothetical protein
MEQSPSWEADQSSQLVKKFTAFLWNPKVLYRTYKCTTTTTTTTNNNNNNNNNNNKVLCKEESGNETNEPSLLNYSDNTTSLTPIEITPKLRYNYN